MVDVVIPRKYKNIAAIVNTGVLGLLMFPVTADVLPNMFFTDMAHWVMGLVAFLTVYWIWKREIGGGFFG